MTLRWGVGQWGVDTWGQNTEGLMLGGHRVRLLVRWYDREDLFPTYFTLREREATYATVRTNYTTYQDVLDNIGGGVELDVDLTCDLAGLTARSGRSSITEHVRASELNFTLIDANGEHDPRQVPIQSRSRIGSRVRLEVKPAGGAWRPIYTAWVDSWRKDLDPTSDPQVDVQSADALKMLARARPAERPGQPEGAGEGVHTRTQRVMDQIPWNDKWGPVSIGSSLSWNTVNPLEWNGDMTALDHLHDIYTVEDGLVWVAPDGTIRFEGDGWRTRRTPFVLGVDMRPNNAAPWENATDAIVCPMSLSADDNDLDIINAMTVWRSVEFDPDVGDPPRRPDVLRRYASDSQSISYYGEHRETLSDLPAWSNTRTQVLADRWVARYKDGAQDIGEFQCDLVRRPQDVEPILNLEWGDTVVVRDQIGDTMVESVHEVVGVSHSITPYRWEARVTLDRKVSS